MRTDRLGLILLALLALAGTAGAYFYFAAPVTMKVAVGPTGSPDDKLLRAFATQLREQKMSVRLTVVPVAGAKEAAEALDAGKAELAVVRPDATLPENGLTLAIMREEVAILVAPAASGPTDIPGLAGKTVGIATRHAADPALLSLLLKHFDLEPPAVTILPLPLAEIPAALRSKRIDAAALIAAPGSSTAIDFARSIGRAVEDKLVVMSAENPDTVAEHGMGIVAATIPEGVWGGRPKQPERSVATIGVTYRLMARSDADRGTIANLTEALFQMRSRLAAFAPSANDMQAPDTDTSTSAVLPNHPGAVDYFQREQQTFWDRYSDVIYMGAFGASGLLSMLAWLGQRFRRQRRVAIDDVLDRLLAILSDARSAETSDRLDVITAEIDMLLATAVQQARHGAVDSGSSSALMLALEGARSAVEDRRLQIRRLPPEEETTPRLATPPRLANAS